MSDFIILNVNGFIQFIVINLLKLGINTISIYNIIYFIKNNKKYINIIIKLT